VKTTKIEDVTKLGRKQHSVEIVCSKHKAAAVQYKNQLTKKQVQLKESEDGLVKAKRDSSTKLSAAEDEVSQRPHKKVKKN